MPKPPSKSLAQPPFVGRGGLKLDAALAHFGIAVAGSICLDIGASTGGFTDCLLQPAPRACMPWMSAPASSTGRFAAIRAWCVHEELNAR